MSSRLHRRGLRPLCLRLPHGLPCPHRRTPKLAVAISQVVGVEAAEAGEAVGEAEAGEAVGEATAGTKTNLIPITTSPRP
jgi:hypothetical protein